MITTAKTKIGLALLVAVGLTAIGCGKKETAEKSDAKTEAAAPGGASKGVGPIQSVDIGAIDPALVAKGEKLFTGTCSACHKLDQRYVGPALAGVTKRRSPEWIMNMIMNPAEMTQKDDTAKALLGTYMVQMSVIATKDDARAALEFFRNHDGT